jgi:hypothetical protein
MFITTSRNIDNLGKKIARYFGLFLEGVKYIPRSRTNLKKIFSRSLYFNYNYFLKIIKAKDTKDKYNLEIYKLNHKQYILEKIYTLNILEIKPKISRSKIKNINKYISDEKNIFYFLAKTNKENNEDFVLKFLKEKTYSFFYKDKEIGFSFKIEKVTSLDR